MWKTLEDAIAMFPANSFRLSKHKSGRGATLYYDNRAAIKWKEKEGILVGKPTSAADVEFTFYITSESSPQEVMLQLMALAIHMELRKAYPQLDVQTELSHYLGSTTYIYQDGALISTVTITPDWTLQITARDEYWELLAPPQALRKVMEVVVSVVPVS